MNKKIIPIVASTLVISATSLLTFSNTAIAKTGIVYNVETGLIIRDTPSKDAKTLDSLLNGASVEVLGEEGNYYKVKYQDITGYVTKSYLKVDGEVPKTEETKTEEKKEEEKQPETKTEEKKEETKTENKVENTTTETNTTPTTTETKTTSSFKAKLLDKAKVYVLPLVNTSKLGEIDKDKEVTVISKTGNWCYIQSESISGWIFTSRVEKVDTPVENKEEKKEEKKTEEKKEEQKNSNKKMYVAFEYCNVREGATTDSAKVTSANHNAEVEILGKEGEWYKVNVNGKTGYIREDQLSESQT